MANPKRKFGASISKTRNRQISSAVSRSADFDSLVRAITEVHKHLAAQAGRAVNVSLTMRNWFIGVHIAEYELHGADRAKYGENLLAELAKRLTRLNVSNCNRRQLYRYLRSYRLYPRIVGTLPPLSVIQVGPRQVLDIAK
jgi:hypothetical protein